MGLGVYGFMSFAWTGISEAGEGRNNERDKEVGIWQKAMGLWIHRETSTSRQQTERDIHIRRQVDRWINRCIDRQTDRWIDRWIGRWIDR